MSEAQIIGGIKDKIASYSVDALGNPRRGGDMQFEYGHACGVISGLQMALEIISNVLEEEHEEHGGFSRGGHLRPLIER